MVPDTFFYHRVESVIVQETMEHMRTAYKDLAGSLVRGLPDCRSKLLALTHLEDSLMRAIQALAIEHGEKVVD